MMPEPHFQPTMSSFQTHFLPPDKIRLRHKEGRFWLKMDGQKIALGEVRRARPLETPDEFIVFEDENGVELGVLRRIEDLEEQSRAHLEEHLAERYACPRIARIFEVERDPLSGLIHWRVEIERENEESEDLPIALPRREWNLLPRALRRSNGDDEVESGREVRFSLAVAEDVQTARYPRIFLTDIDGNRYEIPNCEDLDLASRRAAEKFL